MRNITYCYVFHRQRAKLGPKSGLIPFISCEGNHKHETFFGSPTMSSPEAFLTQNRDVPCSRCCAACRQVTAPPVLGTHHCVRSKAITSVYLKCSPLWPVQSSSPANVPLSNLTLLKWPQVIWVEKGGKSWASFAILLWEKRAEVIHSPASTLNFLSLPFPPLSITRAVLSPKWTV